MVFKSIANILRAFESTKDYSGNVIFYNAHTQYKNLGDFVINKTLIDQLRAQGQLIVNVAGVPEWYREKLELTANERSNRYAVKFRILVFLFGLRSLFQHNLKPYFIIHPGHYYGEVKLHRLISQINSLLYSLILKLIGVRICSFGISIGPFSKLKELAEKWQSRSMYFYSVRDSISKNYAHQIGIDRVEYFPDLAWLMEPPTLPQAPSQVNDDYVVFSFRNSTHKADDSADYEKQLFAVLDQIVDLVCRQWSKQLVISYQVDQDYKFCKVLEQRYQPYGATVIEQMLDTNSMAALYSRAAMVFSNRLHVLMFAMVCGSLPIAVIDAAKHDKITGIFTDAQFDQFILDIRAESNQVEKLPQIAANASPIKAEIASRFEANRRLGHDRLQQVMTGQLEQS